MKKKHHSYSKRTQKSSRSSTIIIVLLSVILALLLGNYFITVFPSSEKKLRNNFNSSDHSNPASSVSESNLTKGMHLLSKPSSPSPTIVIDAGHGGADPGKVSDYGTLEKDINLKIAFYLKEMLESQNINIIMTREEDKDLATETTHRKLSDIKERVKLMENSNADMVVSIHQNSYPDSDVYGAQCFYPTESEAGKTLATIIQNQIITSTNQTKIREIKPNNDYYLLKHASTPIVIVECGFLTNPTEEQLLLSENYQRKMAWSIHLGILEYLNNQ
ncbi:MAG: N-acetylmuramoyl-L-alanine amidase [Lachnospiraceae bacterium]|nr:N-acetylmuramoyl-L-alanine amidase [Lachnospiraceae bacterium]